MSPIEQSIKRKIEAIGVPLKEWDVQIYRGILTGLNEAFIIDSATKDALIAADPKSAEIIRPILRGRDIRRYAYDFADLWIILMQTGDKDRPAVDITQYPAIKEHLDQYYDKLEKRQDKGSTPYHLRSCAYMDDFSKQKIVYAETMRIHRNNTPERFPRFAMVQGEYYLDKTCFMIIGDELMYILGVINSSFMRYYIRKNIAVMDTGGYLMQKIYIEDFPIPKVEESIKNSIAELSRRVLELKALNESTDPLEDQIDRILYAILKLDDAEVKYLNDCSIVL